jgi:site-specific DNA-methyltransferase (adenine-specific)
MEKEQQNSNAVITENYSLYFGDCLEVMKQIPGNSIDMVLCDLPYGKTACNWDSVIPFDALWKQYERIVKDNAAILLFGSEPFSSNLRISKLKLFRYDWIWQKPYKTLHPRASFRPLLEHETISVFYKKQPVYNPQGVIPCDKVIKQKLTTLKDSVYCNHCFKDTEIYNKKFTNYPSTILKIGEHINKKGRQHLHPTQKDISLLEYLIKTYTNEGMVVLDNCMGSGSTGIACLNTGRKFIGIELDTHYFEVSKNRLESWEKKEND